MKSFIPFGQIHSLVGNYYVPKIKAALPRAIEHELRDPGELSRWLEYLHLQAAFKSVGWIKPMPLEPIAEVEAKLWH